MKDRKNKDGGGYKAPSIEGLVSLSIYYTSEEKRELKLLSVETGIPMSELVREGIRYIVKKKKEELLRGQ